VTEYESERETGEGAAKTWFEDHSIEEDIDLICDGQERGPDELASILEPYRREFGHQLVPLFTDLNSSQRRQGFSDAFIDTVRKLREKQ
jgi:hypothetical protein